MSCYPVWYASYSIRTDSISLEKAGYENAVSGLRLDKDKVTAGSSAIDDRMAMEDSAMSELPEEGGTGKTTLVELEAEGQSGTGAGKSNKADSIDADPDQGQSEASKRLGRTRETGAQTVSQGEGDLGKLFMVSQRGSLGRDFPSLMISGTQSSGSPGRSCQLFNHLRLESSV